MNTHQRSGGPGERRRDDHAGDVVGRADQVEVEGGKRRYGHGRARRTLTAGIERGDLVVDSQTRGQRGIRVLIDVGAPLGYLNEGPCGREAPVDLVAGAGDRGPRRLHE